MSLDDDAAQALTELVAAGRYRARRTRSSKLGGAMIVDGRELIDFGSNDYLGLAAHPTLVEAAHQSAQRLGFGAGASRLILGHTSAHAQLEQELAAWLQTPAVLSFSSGYAANTSVIATFADEHTTIFSDQLNHASIIDGCRLSRAEIVVYRHGDASDLNEKLAAARTSHNLVVTESLFSMDGDVVDLAAIDRVRRAYGASLMIDEAHAVGVMGPQGRGAAATAGVVPDLLVGTLGKAFGGVGAFVAGGLATIDLLWNRARPMVFSTGLPPSCAAAATAALTLLASPFGDELRAKLAGHAERLRREIPGILGDAQSPIAPLLIGDDGKTLAHAKKLASLGLMVPAIRPPTVAPGSARLRISLSAGHSHDQVGRLIEALR